MRGFFAIGPSHGVGAGRQRFGGAGREAGLGTRDAQQEGEWLRLSPNSSGCVHDLRGIQPRVPVVASTGGHERRWKSNHNYLSGPREPRSARTFLDIDLSVTVA